MTEFFTLLIAMDPPANTALQSAELSFRSTAWTWLALVLSLALFGCVAVWLFYRREQGTLRLAWRVVATGLRWSLLLLMLLLILRPTLLAEFSGERLVGAVLLIDNSQSMRVRDRRLTAADQARVALAERLMPITKRVDGKLGAMPLGTPKDPPRTRLVERMLTHPDLHLLDDLEKLGPLRRYLCGQDIRGFQALSDFTANEPQTALADGIVKILQRKDSELPSAIVVVTDGQDNASKYTMHEAAEECARLNVPLHIYGVGSSEGARLQWKELAVSDTLFSGDMSAIPLRWQAHGFSKGDGLIILKLDGNIVAEKKIAQRTGDDLRETLTFVVPGELAERSSHELNATIQYRAAGKLFQDELAKSVRILDAKIRILFIEHSPRWEFRFLQPALLRDKRIEADFILVNGDPRIAQTTDPDKPSPYLAAFPKTREEFFGAKYNLIILGDVNARYFSAEQLEWLGEFVRNRGGLVLLAGRQYMPYSYANTPLAELFPVEFSTDPPRFDGDLPTREYPLMLTPEGLRTEWLMLGDTPEENLDVWQSKLPGFHWLSPVKKLRPGATPLIVNPQATMNDGPMSVMASQYYGKGEVLWLGTDETWRWRWNYQDQYFVRFWGQLIYQLGLPSLLGDSGRRAQMDLDRSQAVVGSTSKIFVRLLDKGFNPRKDPQVDAELVYLDAKAGEQPVTPLTLHELAGRRGEYAALLPHDRAGRFELRVRNPEVNTFAFRVDLPARHELRDTGLAEKTLREVARISGGEFYREEDLQRLASNIQPRQSRFTQRQEILLWNPLALIVFLGLITAEWLVRKFGDLA